MNESTSCSKPNDSRLLVVLATFPDAETARQIGTTLVREQLAACVNLIPSIESIYRWEGKVETGDEILAILKTTREAYPALESRLLDLHPYDTPETIALPIVDGASRYLDWLDESVQGAPPLPGSAPKG